MMQTSRLGCLTSSGIITGLIALFAITGLTLAGGGWLYSPGPLNAQAGEPRGGVTSHADLAGDCGGCHVAPWDKGTMADRCSVCHEDIALQMRQAASLHGVMTHRNPALKCAHCHPDHRGAEAPLTMTAMGDFPHADMGYSLTGHRSTDKQEPFQCRDCHTDGISGFDVAVCAECHLRIDFEFTSTHEKDWGGGCLACHDGVDTYGSDFDHNIFNFQLTGRHLDIACYECHSNARSISDLQATQTTCSACHLGRDPHAGRFGTTCEGCHTTTGWQDVTFDHSQSDFPLTGAHQTVECTECHTGGQFSGLSSACVNCHADPVFHAGLFGTECQTCHDTNAWKPASFTGQHAFPLDHGESGAITCSTCHPQNFSTFTCYGCHEHNEAEIQSKHLEEGIPNFQNCMECHPDGREHEGGD